MIAKCREDVHLEGETQGTPSELLIPYKFLVRGPLYVLIDKKVRNEGNTTDSMPSLNVIERAVQVCTGFAVGEEGSRVNTCS